MSNLLQRGLRRVLRFLGSHPALKRAIVDIVYRFPVLDGKLRTVAHRVIHPEAVLDVDASRMPEASRRAYHRIRGDFRS